MKITTKFCTNTRYTHDLLLKFLSFRECIIYIFLLKNHHKTGNQINFGDFQSIEHVHVFVCKSHSDAVIIMRKLLPLFTSCHEICPDLMYFVCEMQTGVRNAKNP